MINKDGGGQFLDFMGDIDLMGVPPVPPLGKTLLGLLKSSSLIDQMQWAETR